MSNNKSLLEMYNEKHKIEEFDIDKWCHNLYIRCNNMVVCGDKLPYTIIVMPTVSTDKQLKVASKCANDYGICIGFNQSGTIVSVVKFVAPRTLRIN